MFFVFLGTALRRWPAHFFHIERRLTLKCAKQISALTRTTDGLDGTCAHRSRNAPYPKYLLWGACIRLTYGDALV
jgi:hypothetical protein